MKNVIFVYKHAKMVLCKKKLNVWIIATRIHFNMNIFTPLYLLPFFILLSNICQYLTSSTMYCFASGISRMAYLLKHAKKVRCKEKLNVRILTTHLEKVYDIVVFLVYVVCHKYLSRVVDWGNISIGTSHTSLLSPVFHVTIKTSVNIW